MKLLFDTHTHTIASDHAYSTVTENAAAAAAAGLAALGTTDHTPPLCDAPDVMHFTNQRILPRSMSGVRMLYGAELNICDYDGSLGLEPRVLSRLDYAIASFHDLVLKPGDIKENTRAYLGAMDSPYVAIIGHPDDGKIPVDFRQLVLAAKSTGTLLELNNSSLRTAVFRLNARENLKTMLRLCAEEGVSISVGTDAHYSTYIGDFTEALELLAELDFPQELVATLDADRFLAFASRKRG